MSTDKLLTLPQAAEYLGIKDHVLHNAFYRSNKTEPDPTYIRRRLYLNTSELDRIKNEGIAFREKSQWPVIKARAFGARFGWRRFLFLLQ